MTNSKDMHWIATQLQERLPGVAVDVLKPSAQSKTAGWTLDASYRDSYVVVQWTRSTGFGISAPKDTDLLSPRMSSTTKAQTRRSVEPCICS